MKNRSQVKSRQRGSVSQKRMEHPCVGPTNDRESQGWISNRNVIISQILILICIAIFAQVRIFNFISLDDGSYVYDNPEVRAGLTLQGLRWAFTTFHSTNWHPLTWISHMLDAQLFGMNAGYHHLTNVLFHIVNTLLLYFVFKRMTGAMWRSALIAALFAVHPLHVESVAWVSERKDVLSTLFWLLTMWAYARYAETPSWKKYISVVLLFALGLLAKPMLITLPFALLLLDYWPLGRVSWGDEDTFLSFLKKARPLILEKLPLIGMALASTVVTFMAQRSGGAVRSLDAFSFKLRIANAFVSYIKYIVKMIWPSSLALWYPYDKNLPLWLGAIAGVALIAISVAVIRAARHREYLFTGWFWYLGTLVPVIGLVQVGAQSLADRYTYIPFIGLFVILAWGGAEFVEFRRIPKTGVAVAVIAILIVLGVISWKQTSYWRDNETVYSRAVAVTTDNWLAHHNLCVGLLNEDRPDEAYEHCTEAVRISPGHIEAQNSMGVVLLQQARYLDAAQYFLNYIKSKPDEPRVYLNLAQALAPLGRTAEARQAYEQANRLDPKLEAGPERYVLACVAMAEALANERDFAEAERFTKQALELDPTSADALAARAKILLFQNRLSEAYNAATEAVKANPKNSRAHNILGQSIAARGNVKEAVTEFSTALKLNPHNLDAQANMRKAQSVLGDKK